MSDVALVSLARSQLVAEAGQAEDGNETGGLLLGYDMGMGAGFEVRLCGGPGPNAIRQPAHFMRDLGYSTALAERAAETDGSVWIGEWHTHLAELPMPSAFDLVTYRKLLAGQESRLLPSAQPDHPRRRGKRLVIAENLRLVCLSHLNSSAFDCGRPLLLTQKLPPP